MSKIIKIIKKLGWITCFLILFPASGDPADHPRFNTPSVSGKVFRDYWYSRGAELNRYRLEQARYGELHSGEAILVFVTEDFNPAKQVKADHPNQKSIPILKLNRIKKFNTGIYTYSMMTSIFTPTDVAKSPHTLKVSTSSQEWCGHTFGQLNYRNGGYQASLRSYFETEGDKQFRIDSAWLEDEIWTRIRIAPSTLPQGVVKIISGTMSARLRHRQSAVETARAVLEKQADDQVKYTLDYQDSKRKLAVFFNEKFPHEILGWEETYLSGWWNPQEAEVLTTKATRTHKLMLDYWNKHRKTDSRFREKLGLEF